MNIGEQVKRYREAAGFSIYKLAKLTQVTEARVKAIEEGKSFRAETLYRLCNALDLECVLRPYTDARLADSTKSDTTPIK